MKKILLKIPVAWDQEIEELRPGLSVTTFAGETLLPTMQDMLRRFIRDGIDHLKEAQKKKGHK